MRLLDISSWQGLLTTVVALALITLIGVGIRLLVMQTIQQRRQRENRQINERLRTLIAAYKTLGGSFSGNLAVDPTHLRDLRRQAQARDAASGQAEATALPADNDATASSDRSRRIRDAVEAALSDVLLLGTEAQVRLAAQAAADLAAGRSVHTAKLVASLRDFIRQVLDLDPVPPDLPIPRQGPTRPTPSGRGGGRDVPRDGNRAGGEAVGGMGGGAAAGGAALGLGSAGAGSANVVD
jgi:type II secretory pathway pseudopilin PulG